MLRVFGHLFMAGAAIVVALPILIVCSASPNGGRTMYFPPQDPTLARFGEFFLSEPVWTRALTNSVIVALGSATLAVILAWPIAYALWKTGSRHSATLAALGSIPFALPPIVFGDDRIVKANEAGTDSALREATIARLAGFTIVGSNSLDEDEAYACHMTAIAFGNVAPVIPEGATMGSRIASEGLALRYLRDYNPTATNAPVDRSLVDAFVGAASVDDEDTSTNKRGVEITFTPLGS